MDEKVKQALEKIETICDSIKRDCGESDKVFIHASSICYEIAKIYPKYTRKEG